MFVAELPFLLLSLLLSQAVLIIFSFHAKLCLARRSWNVDERRKLKGKRLFKCTVSFCLHLAFTLVICGQQ